MQTNIAAADRAKTLKDQCVALLCDNPNVDLKLLGEATAGKIKQAKDETSKEGARVLINALDWIYDSSTNKPIRRGGRKAKAADDSTGEKPKKRGRPPKKKPVELQQALPETAEAQPEDSPLDTTETSAESQPGNGEMPIEIQTMELEEMPAAQAQ